MTRVVTDFDEAVRAELLRAFEQYRPRMIADARADAELDPASRLGDFSDADLEQFLNAYEALFREALTDGGRETRKFIIDTALPPIIELGQTVPDMSRSNAISDVMLTYRLLPLVAEEHRDEAVRCLAAFLSDYHCDVITRALELTDRSS